MKAIILSLPLPTQIIQITHLWVITHSLEPLVAYRVLVFQQRKANVWDVFFNFRDRINEIYVYKVSG